MQNSSMPYDEERQILVFGGPYSNLQAVLALRSRAHELKISADRCFCTGDRRELRGTIGNGGRRLRLWFCGRDGM